MGASKNPQGEVRLLLARWRAERGESAPTLGRFFPDNPGVRHTGDDPPIARLMAFEQWAVEDAV